MSASATQGGLKKTKARFSRLLQHPALHKSVTYLFRHLPTYLQSRTHTWHTDRQINTQIHNITHRLKTTVSVLKIFLGSIR